MKANKIETTWNERLVPFSWTKVRGGGGGGGRRCFYFRGHWLFMLSIHHGSGHKDAEVKDEEEDKEEEEQEQEQEQEQEDLRRCGRRH